MTHRSLVAVLLLCSTLGPDVAAASDARSQVLGVWEYRQTAGRGYDREGERLELRSADGTVRGAYLGLEREGEHGLFYTAVEVKDLVVESEGGVALVRFVVPERDLFHERPRSVEEGRRQASRRVGLTREELRFAGRVTGDTLTLQCTSKGYSCPESVMVFRRVSEP